MHLHPVSHPLFRLAGCALVWIAAAAVVTPMSSWLPDAQAQTLRTFPARALRGNMTFVDAVHVVLDGQQERLSPGVRVRNQQNRIVFPNSLSGRNFAVNYFRDAAGRINEVWILTPAEMSRDLRKSAPNRLQGAGSASYIN
jgi:hypothetical protein